MARTGQRPRRFGEAGAVQAAERLGAAGEQRVAGGGVLAGGQAFGQRALEALHAVEAQRAAKADDLRLTDLGRLGQARRGRLQRGGGVGEHDVGHASLAAREALVGGADLRAHGAGGRRVQGQVQRAGGTGPGGAVRVLRRQATGTLGRHGAQRGQAQARAQGLGGQPGVVDEDRMANRAVHAGQRIGQRGRELGRVGNGLVARVGTAAVAVQQHRLQPPALPAGEQARPGLGVVHQCPNSAR